MFSYSICFHYSSNINQEIILFCNQAKPINHTTTKTKTYQFFFKISSLTFKWRISRILFLKIKREAILKVINTIYNQSYLKISSICDIFKKCSLYKSMFYIYLPIVNKFSGFLCFFCKKNQWICVFFLNIWINVKCKYQGAK